MRYLLLIFMLIVPIISYSQSNVERICNERILLWNEYEYASYDRQQEIISQRNSLLNELFELNLPATSCIVYETHFDIEKQLLVDKTNEELFAAKVDELRKKCELIGFENSSEEMASCILKMMEIDNVNNSVVSNTYEYGTSQELLDIEREKLATQRSQLEAEQERVEQERRRDQKEASKELMNMGNCLLSGGGWGCGY